MLEGCTKDELETLFGKTLYRSLPPVLAFETGLAEVQLARLSVLVIWYLVEGPSPKSYAVMAITIWASHHHKIHSKRTANQSILHLLDRRDREMVQFTKPAWHLSQSGGINFRLQVHVQNFFEPM